jgi:lipoteichoic acid synthase
MADAAPAPFPAARYAAYLAFPLGLVCLLTKAHKLIAAKDGDLLSGLAAIFPDVIFLLVAGLVAFAALRYTRGYLRGSLRVILHLLVFLLTVFVFIEHGFWITTGTLLDPYTLGYGLEHIGPLGKVFLSEMKLGVWLGFAAILAVQFLPLLATRRPSPPSDSPRRPLALLGLLGLAPACTGVAVLAADVPPEVLPLTDNVVVTFAADFISPEIEADAAIGPGHPEVVLGTGSPALAKPGNVIVIIMESLRARSMGVYDPKLDTTPFLQSLAKEGAVVDFAWPAVTHTSKAIVGILCGIYPKLDVPIEEAEPTGLPTPCLAKLLADRGYETAFMQTATASFERRDQLIKNMAYHHFESKETLPTKGFEETSYFGFEDRALVKPALDWLAKVRTEKKPHFLTLLTLSTHHTYKTPSNFEKKRRATGEVDDYLNAIHYLDTTLSELFAGFDKLGVREDTLIVLIGDHGEGFGEHGRRQHDAVIYEEGLHIPIMVVGPKVPEGVRIKGLRHAIDVVPTALEWLGTPATSGLPGKSLLTTEGHTDLFAACWLRQRCMAIRRGDQKFIWHFDKQPPELFDLVKDPLERKDLLKETPEVTWGPMKDRLLVWKQDEDALWAGFFARATQNFVGTERPAPSTPIDLTFSDEDGRPLVKLIGLDGATRVKSGDPLKVTLHWEVLRAPGAQWKVFTHFLGVSANARPRFNADHVPVAGRHPVGEWKPGTFVSDPFRIQPDKPLPPGTYHLVVGLWDESSKAEKHLSRASVSGTGGEVDAERRAHVLTVEVY